MTPYQSVDSSRKTNQITPCSQRSWYLTKMSWNTWGYRKMEIRRLLQRQMRSGRLNLRGSSRFTISLLSVILIIYLYTGTALLIRYYSEYFRKLESPGIDLILKPLSRISIWWRMLMESSTQEILRQSWRKCYRISRGRQTWTTDFHTW